MGVKVSVGSGSVSAKLTKGATQESINTAKNEIEAIRDGLEVLASDTESNINTFNNTTYPTKLSEFNSNATAKLNEYNSNHSDKLDDIDLHVSINVEPTLDEKVTIATTKANEASVSASNALTQANRAETEADRAEASANSLSLPLIDATNSGGILQVNSTGTGYQVGQNYGFKNYIINGGFDVWQRGTSFTGANEYTADRWLISGIGKASPIALTRGVPTQSAHWENGIYKHAQLLTPSNWGSATQVNFEQKIEDLKRFSKKTLTASFYVKGNIGLSNSDFTLVISENYGGGSSTVYHTKADFASVIAGDIWRRVSFTFTVSDLSTKTFGSSASYLSCIFVVKNTAPSNNIIQIANVQLEEGSVATPFEQRPYGLELSLCQRYYWRVINPSSSAIQYGVGGSQAQWVLAYPTIMRTTPTSTIVDYGTYSNSSAGVVNTYGGTYSARLSAVVNNTGNAQWFNQVIEFDAEL